MKTNPLLVEALRGSALESAHRGAVAIVDGDGRRVLALGEVERAGIPALGRQAAAGAAAGSQRRGRCAEAGRCRTGAGLRLAQRRAGARKIRRAACSPSAGPRRRRARMRYTPAGAGCGWSRARRARRAPTALHNNCSGKHAAFLCPACRCMDARRLRVSRGYVEPQHAVMREVSAALQAATDCDSPTRRWAPTVVRSRPSPSRSTSSPRLRTRRHRPGLVGRPRPRGAAAARRDRPRALHGGGHGPFRHARDGSCARARLL